MEEPSVLDYVRSKLNPKKWGHIHLPELVEEHEPEKPQVESLPEPGPEPGPELDREPEPVLALADEKPVGVPWRMTTAFFLAVAAQTLLEPPRRSFEMAVALYALSAVLIIWSLWVKEVILPEVKPQNPQPMWMKVRRGFPWVVLPLMLVSFLAFGGNRFTALNVILWFVLLIYVFVGLWQPQAQKESSLWKRLVHFLKRPETQIKIQPFHLLLLAALGLAVFFRFYHLAQVPGEMFSDHAEKLLDVSDVLEGQYSIFFPRNTGREAFQMYLSAAVSILFGTGLSFLTLKIGTALAGLFTLPYVYLLGKEVGGRWVGLLAFTLAAVAYWPNVIARVALRFALYPLFVAPVLYYLIRGLRTSSRNDLLLAGLFLGVGLHGYSPMRIVPFVIVAAMGIYLLHPQSKGKRTPVVFALLLLAFVSLLVFLPLLRYILEDPQMFAYRAFSRLGENERAFPGPVGLIFVQNLWKACVMFFWDNGGIWVHSIPGRPALDFVTAALYFLGVILLIGRYLRTRNWADLFLLVSIPLLMMPSILSLAFPDENPSLNRTGGAYIPVFITAAVGLESLLRTLIRRPKLLRTRALVVILGAVMLCVVAANNYTLVFDKFSDQFLRGAWNTTQIGRLIRSFADSVGSADSAYVVPFAHWVDTRLVGINAGYPLKDYALWPEHFGETLTETRAKLFILKPEDEKALTQLEEMYPQGNYWTEKGPFEGKDFLAYFVPAQPGSQP